jgi:dTMP kinase
MRKLEFFGAQLPSAPQTISGRLIVIEGPDNSGRSTQIQMLRESLEREGHAVTDIGLKRSTLVSKELDEAMEGNVLGAVTLALFYATDFLDQVENEIIPALRAGFIVLADRYIYTLIARATVRGIDRNWVSGVYSLVPKPDAVFYLKVDPRTLLQRRFLETPYLDYWESGMDIGLSSDMYTSFYQYQNLMQQEFQRLSTQHEFQVIDGTKRIDEIHRLIRQKVRPIVTAVESKPRKRAVRALKATNPPVRKRAPRKRTP